MYVNQLPEQVSGASRKSRRPSLGRGKAKGTHELPSPLSVEQAEAKLERLRTKRKAGE